MNESQNARGTNVDVSDHLEVHGSNRSETRNRSYLKHDQIRQMLASNLLSKCMDPEAAKLARHRCTGV